MMQIQVPRSSPIARLNREMVAVPQSPGMQGALLTQGAEPAVSTPAVAAFIKSETLKWGQVVRAAGIKPE
jgi:tripartite-type tricarboxylate transporter receptor subunit TctC